MPSTHHETLSPRVLRRDAPRVPLMAASYRPTFLIVVTGTIAVLAAVVAFAADDLGFRIIMASYAVLIAAAGAIARSWAESISEHVVRIDPSVRGLCFAASPRSRMLFFALAGAALAPAVVALVFALGGMPTSMGSGIGRWGPYAIGLIALGGLAQQLWAQRIPSGLTLTEGGLRGIRSAARIDLGWDELASVAAVAERGAKLMLQTTNGTRLRVEPRWIGSDPNAVAAIVNHFLEHPADRALLDDPQAAIRRVEDVLANQ